MTVFAPSKNLLAILRIFFFKIFRGTYTWHFGGQSTFWSTFQLRQDLRCFGKVRENRFYSTVPQNSKTRYTRCYTPAGPG